MGNRMGGRIRWGAAPVVLLALLLVAVVAPARAHASESSVTFDEWGWDGSQLTKTTRTQTCTEWDDDMDDLRDGGWYVMHGNEDMHTRMKINGTVNFVLGNGCKLELGDGIRVNEGATLNLYAEVGENPGQLICDDKNDCAGIGGDYEHSAGTINIHGGDIETLGGSVSYDGGAGIGGGGAGNGGTINIYSGTVKATGGANAAGIGGGDGDNAEGNGGNISIYGGTVTAKGGSKTNHGGAGIGGGYKQTGGTIRVHGGSITATGGANAAGIGGGEGGSGPEFEMWDGEVTTTGGSTSYDGGAGIGSGHKNDRSVSGGTVKIHGGKVKATGGADGAGIGGGDEVCGADVEISGGTVEAQGGKYGAGIGSGDADGEGKHGGTLKIYGGNVTATGGYDGAGIGGGEGASGAEVEIRGGTVIAKGSPVENGDTGAGIGSGEKDGKDIHSGKVSIWDGTVEAHGGKKGGGAGIGGGKGVRCEEVHIYGGEVKAYGSTYGGGAGIGGGRDGVLRKLEITGGTVTAEGGASAAGIGGGEYGNSELVIITGGKVTTTGGARSFWGGAGIGGGNDASNGTVSITGGEVYAEGGGWAAGIGGGDDGAGGNVNISGENTVVTAKGPWQSAAGIGGGKGQGFTAITIDGGTVTATGGDGGAGIGDGKNGSGGTITITAGTVTATGSEYGAGIGGGYLGVVDAISITGGKVTATGGKAASGIGTGGMNRVEFSDKDGTITIGGTADVTATGGEWGAGIGGGFRAGSGKVLIQDGKVTATGGESGGAGIGSGEMCDHKDRTTVDVTIDGGEVYAKGGARKEFTGGWYEQGAGIGVGGDQTVNGTFSGSYFKGTINLNGGTVTVDGNGSTPIGTTNKEKGLDGVTGAVRFNGATVTMTNIGAEAAAVNATDGQIGIKDDASTHQRVKYGTENTIVAVGERISTLTSTGMTPVIVEPCEHESKSYAGKDAAKHTVSCAHCGLVADEDHAFSDPVWTWAENHSSATAKFTCEQCGYVKTRGATVASHVDNNNEKRIYTATVEEGGQTYTDTQEEELEAIQPQVSIENWTYGDAAKEPTLGEGSNPGGGAVTFEYAKYGTDAYSSIVPTDAGNYTVRATIASTATHKSGSAYANFTISPLSVTVTGATAVGRAYEKGNTSVAISNVAFQKGDGQPVTLSMGPDYTATGVLTGDNASYAGNAKPVDVTVTLVSGNYTLAQPTVSTTVNITKAPAPAIADVQDLKFVNDGLQYIVEQSVANVMPTDAGGLSYTAGTATTSSSSFSVTSFNVIDEGGTKGTVFAVITCNGSPSENDFAKLPVKIDSTNYETANVNVVVSFTNKTIVGVTLGTYPVEKTYGDDNNVFTLTASLNDTGVSGGTWTWASSDDSILKVTGNGPTANVEILKAGTAMVAAVYEDSNHIGVAVTNSITVKKYPITVKAKNQEIYVGDEVPTLNGNDGYGKYDYYTVYGQDETDVLTQDELAQLPTRPTLSYSPAEVDNTKPGTYDIVPDWESLTSVGSGEQGALTVGDCFSINYLNGTLTVKPKEDARVTIVKTSTTESAPSSKTYGDGSFQLTASANNTAGDPNGTWSWTSDNEEVLRVTEGANGGVATIEVLNAGVAKLTASYASGTTAGSASVTITVNPAPLLVAAKSLWIRVGGAIPSLANPVAGTHFEVDGLVGEDALTTLPTLSYQKDGQQATPSSAQRGTYDIVPTGADAGGNYSISYANGTLTVNEKDPAYVTAPPAAQVVAYNGDAQPLATAGSAAGGTMLYALGANGGGTPAEGQFSQTIPTGKDIGDYTVWYMVKGDDDHDNSNQFKVISTITKAQSSVTEAPQATNPTYIGEPQELVTPGSAAGGTMLYALGADGGEAPSEDQFSDEVPTANDAGTYTVWYRVAGDDNHYNTSPQQLTSTISKAASSVVLEPSAINPAYNGGPQALVSAGRAEGGEMQYSLDGKTWSKEVPTGTEIGSYVVWYKVAVDTNHIETEPQLLAANILKGASSVKVAPRGKTLTYTGKPQALVTPGTAEGGTMKYSLNGKDWSENVPTGTAAKEYVVWYKVVGDDKHSDSGIDSVTATIAYKTYKVSVAKVVNGTVSVSPTEAKAGETVRVTATPASGYELSAVTVKDAYLKMTKVTDGAFTMPASDVTVSATFKIAPAPTPDPTPAPTKTFPDVPADAWYAGVVGRAAELGLINGYRNGNFGPNDSVTRGQIAVILWNMAGKPSPKGTPKSFPDVAAGKYYYDAVRWASSVGVVNGYKNGRFGPDDLVTREQLAVMLANYADRVAGKDTTGSAADYKSMKDASKVSSWAARSVGWCFRNMIMSGTKQGYVNPQGNATRAETAKMVVFLQDLL